jgi:hypothetical protein
MVGRRRLAAARLIAASIAQADRHDEMRPRCDMRLGGFAGTRPYL